ncbi:MAG: HD family phosphohydrolase, partial [Chthoniobacterales bacterium]
LQVRRRSRLIRAGLFVGLAIWLLSLTFGLIGPINLFNPGATDWTMIGVQSAFAIGNGIVTAMVVGGALPILEHLFAITTDISWLEASDLNHPLLRRMTIEAPGTYHHSLVVANLAESAAEAIGANATLCRVCSYFHDVGKLVKPEYFTENMNFERNPHDDLAPTMSALIIIAHVKEGVDLALKHGLNQQVIDVIQQHHGTSLVFYFYKRALQQHEDARAGGKIMKMREEDIPEVSEESFRYSGPRPQSKEAGIISLADMVESASRSLEKPTPAKIEQLVNDLIDQRLADHQLDECDLTLRELRTIAERFRFTLMNMLHTRIAYPKEGKPASGREDGERAGAMMATKRPASAPPVSAA